VSVPADPRLPQLGRLLDSAAMTGPLARSLGREAAVEDVEVARVRYAPGERALVHYRARVDGTACDAVATAAADRRLDRLVAKERHRVLARIVNGRSPAVDPFTYDARLDAAVAWLPFDPGLPALALPTPLLLRRLAEIGVPFASADADLVRTGYKPGERAVLRCGAHVLKAYGGERRFRAAVAGLAAGMRALRTTEFAASLADLRLTVQAAVPGSVPPDATGAATGAGRLLHALQQAPPAGLPPRTEGTILETAVRRAGLARTVVPTLGPRLDALLERLAALPAGAPLVPAHGDFNVDQLLLDGAELHVVDLDELCTAPPAHDVAAYAADVVRGRPGDGAELAAVLPPLLQGYGGEPPDLRRHLATAILSRAPHAFLKLLPGWPERVAGTVAAAELALELEWA
jgi:hypothetical protein